MSEGFREWEDQKEELSVLRAEVLQRRNELARQKRIRSLNERTFAATRDRTHRAEGLVNEMRADLKSLKDRLDCELEELGIDWDKAASLLEAHYKEQEKEALEGGDVSPPKVRNFGEFTKHNENTKANSSPASKAPPERTGSPLSKANPSQSR